MSKIYSGNVIAGLHNPAQPAFSGNLAKLGNIESKRFDELEFRLKQLEEFEQQNIIQSAFGHVRTSVATTTTMPVTTTKRSLTLCEKRSIAEQRRCKTTACFRHRCLVNGDFSPTQCWPKLGLCWCVTIEGMKLSKSIRKTAKFMPK